MEKCEPFCKEMHLVEASKTVNEDGASAIYKCVICGFPKKNYFKNGK